jgi:hypothetical protein
MAEKSADDWVDEGLEHYGMGRLPQALEAGQRALDSSRQMRRHCICWGSWSWGWDMVMRRSRI